MEESPHGHRTTPLQVMGLYFVVGVSWLLVTHQLTGALDVSAVVRAQIQTAAAVAFVAVSALLLYLQTRYNHRRLAAATADLEDRIQQAHVLHRLLRHNLRNKCNIIAGHAQALRADGSGEGGAQSSNTAGGGSAATIERQTAEMVALSEKSNLLRDVSLAGSRPGPVDLVPIIEAVAADMAETYGVTVRTTLPDEAEVYAHAKIDQAIRELVVNGIKHGAPPVEVHIEQEGTTDTVVRVVDHGGGFPDLERQLLEEGFRETQTAHSKGLGLWVVRYLMQECDGSATVERTDDEGTTIRLRFQPTTSAAIKQFLR